jgi:two-component system, chemotaxis family, protein-glutamate methylesterase/glutaminase
MPESAIATGCIDFILSPEDIARQIVRIATGAPEEGKAK